MRMIPIPEWLHSHASATEVNSRSHKCLIHLACLDLIFTSSCMQTMIIVLHMARPPACAVHKDYRIRRLRVTVMRGDRPVESHCSP